MSERREYPRIRRKRKIGFLLSDGTIEYLWTTDISRGGMQLHTRHLVDAGDQFSVAFGVFDYDQNKYVQIRARIEVVHKVYDGTAGVFRIGTRFIGFEGDGADTYTRHIKELERSLL